jgi:hypothetical protein
MTTVLDDFDAAKAVHDSLKDIPKDRQERILRWVFESLGIKLASADFVVGSSASQPQSPPLGPHVTAPSASQGGIDVKSFINSKAPKSDNQFAAAVAYYYRFEAPAEKRRDSINSEILQEATRLVGRDRLPKPHVTLAHAKNGGYLDSAERGEYRINHVGENLVAMTLGGGGGSPERRPTRKKSKIVKRAKKVKK